MVTVTHGGSGGDSITRDVAPGAYDTLEQAGVVAASLNARLEAHREYMTNPAVTALISVLASPDMVAMREMIQDVYGRACQAGKLAGDQVRAASRHLGEVSPIGRDRGERLMAGAERVCDEISGLWDEYHRLFREYHDIRAERMAGFEGPPDPLDTTVKLVGLACRGHASPRGL